jgi:methyl-accepting chemotaxis protein
VWFFHPPPRYIGFHLAGVEAPHLVIWLEWGLLASLSWATMQIPIVFTRRVRRARKVLAAMEGGDFTPRLSTRSTDDLAFLSLSLNSMAQTVGALVNEIQGKAQSLAGHADQLAGTSETVTEITEVVSSTTTHIADEAERQRGLIEQSRGIGEQAASDARAMQSEAAASTERARSLVSEAQMHTQRIGRAGELLVELSGEYQETSRAMEALAEAGERVTSFMGVIRELSEQTQLLALNASIEAARAGQHGHGFAVVAEEVHKLSQQSNTAASQVAGLVRQTRTAIRDAQVRLEAGSRKLSDVGEVASGGQSSLASIAGGLRRMVSDIERTATLVHGQSGAMDQLVRRLRDVQEIADSTVDAAHQNVDASRQQTAMMQELNAMSQDLAQTAQMLHRLAVRFQVADD